jgi:hypothetical protein
MGLVVSHQPDFGVVGTGAMSIGSGKRLRYEDELARQEAARRRAEAMQAAEFQHKLQQTQVQNQMQQREFALRAGAMQFDRQMKVAEQQRMAEQFDRNLQQQSDLQQAGYDQQYMMDKMNFSQAQRTQAQEIEFQHAQMVAKQQALGFEYDEIQQQALDNVQAKRAQLIADKTLTPEEYDQALLSVAMEQARIIPTKRKQPPPNPREQLEQEVIPIGGGTLDDSTNFFVRTGNGWSLQSLKTEKAEKPAISPVQMLAIADKIQDAAIAEGQPLSPDELAQRVQERMELLQKIQGGGVQSDEQGEGDVRGAGRIAERVSGVPPLQEQPAPQGGFHGGRGSSRVGRGEQVQGSGVPQQQPAPTQEQVIQQQQQQQVAQVKLAEYSDKLGKIKQAIQTGGFVPIMGIEDTQKQIDKEMKAGILPKAEAAQLYMQLETAKVLAKRNKK